MEGRDGSRKYSREAAMPPDTVNGALSKSPYRLSKKGKGNEGPIVNNSILYSRPLSSHVSGGMNADYRCCSPPSLTRWLRMGKGAWT
jgi:hypothetical protein